jgi:hypothetical protein
MNAVVDIRILNSRAGTPGSLIDNVQNEENENAL